MGVAVTHLLSALLPTSCRCVPSAAWWGEEEEEAMARGGMRSDVGLSLSDPKPVEANVEVSPSF